LDKAVAVENLVVDKAVVDIVESFGYLVLDKGVVVETPVVETPVVDKAVVETPVVETPVVDKAVLDTSGFF
jgi:hypothetical protein